MQITTIVARIRVATGKHKSDADVILISDE